MPHAMVALIGAQPLPNLLPVRTYRPDLTLCVYTTRTAGVYDRLRQALGAETTVCPLETTAYDIPSIGAALADRLAADDLRAADLTFNLTGGTKAMSLAAYQVARERGAAVCYLESEGRQSRVYHYDWEGGQLRRQRNEILAPHVTIADLLNLGFGAEKWTFPVPNDTNEGYPFEAAIVAALQPPHVDEVVPWVKTRDGQLDLDAVVRIGNQFGIVEAKAGRKGTNLDGVKQLNTAGQQLGLYTQRLYAITVAPFPSHEALRAAAGITPISLPEYAPGATTLPPEAAARLVAAVRRQVCGAEG